MPFIPDTAEEPVATSGRFIPDEFSGDESPLPPGEQAHAERLSDFAANARRTRPERLSGAVSKFLGLTESVTETAESMALPVAQVRKGIAGIATNLGFFTPDEFQEKVERIDHPAPLLPSVPLQEGSIAAKVGAGAANAIIEFANGMVGSPDAILHLGLATVPSAFRKHLLTSFATIMAVEAPQQLDASIDSMKEGDIQGAAQHITAGSGALVMGRMIGKDASKAPKPSLPDSAAKSEMLAKALDASDLRGAQLKKPTTYEEKATAPKTDTKAEVPAANQGEVVVEGSVPETGAIKLEASHELKALAPQTAAVVARATEIPKVEPQIEEPAPAIKRELPEPEATVVAPEAASSTAIKTSGVQVPASPVEAAKSGAQEAQAEVTKVAKAEGQRSAKDIKAELVSEITKAIESAPLSADVEPKFATKVSGERYETQPDSRTKVTIEIPGDGSFTVWNTKEALTELLGRAKRIVTKAGAEPSIKRRGTSAEDKAEIERLTKAGGGETGMAGEPAPKPISTPPEMTGMGAAVPSEFAKPGTHVSNMFAAIDADRAAMGKEPMPETRTRTWDQDNTQALAKMNRDPGWVPNLIAEVTANPRPLLSWENAGLVWQRHAWKAEANNALARIARAFEDNRFEDLEAAKLDATRFEEQLEALDRAVGRNGTGSEAGRSLQAQKMAAGEDFTLVEMRLKARAAKGGEPLTDLESKEISDIHTKLAAAEKAAAEAAEAAQTRIATLEIEKALAEARAAGPAYEPRVLAAAEKFAKFMDKKGDDALARIKARLGRTSAGVDPTILSDVGILGAAKLTRGIVDFAKWTDAMTRDLGEWFREHAQEAWDASQKVFASENEQFHKGVDKATKDKVKRATDLPGRIDNAKESVKVKAAKGEGSPIHSEVRKLVRLLVEQDPKITRESLIDTVHAVLTESMPDITRLEAMDAISGRGKFWTPAQDEISRTVRDLGAQIRLVGHQIDVEAGRPMPRTGFQPDKLSTAASLEKKKLNDLMRKHGVVVTDPAAQLGSLLQSLKTRLEREKADLQERLAKGDFSPRRKNREMPLDREAAAAKAEVILLREQFQRGLDKANYERKSRAEKIWIGAKESLNISRALLTSWDVSAVFRQGGFIAIGNPLRAARNLKPMFEALASNKRAVAIEAEIASRPNAKLYAQSKLFLAPREGSRLSGMEEAFMSRLAAKIPGVGASGRAYITFLNKLRADTFDALHESLVSSGEARPGELESISNYINIATGRGNLGKAAPAAEVLATAFFAPRLVASRFQLLAGAPLYRGSARTRYLVAKEYAKFLTGLGVVYTLGQLAGADVETDPRSSDFGKLKFGNTRVDPLSGLAQTTVLSSRVLSGERVDSKGRLKSIRGGVKFGDPDTADVLGQFLRTKLSPVLGTAVDIATGKNVVGEPVTPGSVAQNTLTPLAMRDIYAVMTEQGIPAGTAISLLSLFGMSVQNYEAGKK